MAKEQTLNDIPLEQVHLAQQAALVRLQLFVVGEIHRLLLEVTEVGAAALRKGSRTDPLDPTVATQARKATLEAWDNFLEQYTQLTGAGIYFAAAFPFGGLAVMHNKLVLPVAEDEENTAAGNATIELPDPWQVSIDRMKGLTEAETPRAPDGVFSPQMQEIIDAVYRRVYQDKLKLSDRIWKLDQASRADIDRIIYNALANGWSAWDTAEKLEGALGAGQGCPRWTHERLFGLEKKDIASGDRTGLITGAECNGQGVAYNALRLARTEIQASHHMANDMVFAKMPWIVEEQIMLSPAHAKRDECDDVVEGGRDGKGIYKKGEIKLPRHPHCMCIKLAVLMDNQQFIDQLRGWMRNETAWTEMDQYSEMIGGNMLVDLAQSGVALMMDYWLWKAGEAVGSLFWSIASGS